MSICRCFRRMMATPSGLRTKLTVGDNTLQAGFEATIFGSLVNEKIVHGGGDPITVLRFFSYPGVLNLRIDLYSFSVNPGQDFFTKAILQDGTGAKRVYETASADTFAFFSGVAFWGWGDGSDPAYEIADSGEIHPVSIVL